MRMLTLALCLALAACTDPAPTSPTGWEYGPECINDSGSCGVPAGPAQTAEGMVLEIPPEPAHINYVTRRTGSLAGKSHIRMRYRVEGGPIRATKPRGEVYPGIITLYFAHRDNDFGGGPTQNWYRWYAPGSTTILAPGEYSIVMSFTDLWTAVNYGGNVCGHDMSNDPDCLGPSRFSDALANADRVGFVLGGGDGLGHGVHGTGRIIVTEFAVE